MIEAPEVGLLFRLAISESEIVDMSDKAPPFSSSRWRWWLLSNQQVFDGNNTSSAY